MPNLTTVVSDETSKKMDEIAQMLCMTEVRHARAVIEKAVDLLYQKLTIERLAREKMNQDQLYRDTLKLTGSPISGVDWSTMSLEDIIDLLREANGLLRWGWSSDEIVRRARTVFENHH
jgi:predicted transcriptional regulator